MKGHDGRRESHRKDLERDRYEIKVEDARENYEMQNVIRPEKTECDIIR